MQSAVVSYHVELVVWFMFKMIMKFSTFALVNQSHFLQCFLLFKCECSVVKQMQKLKYEYSHVLLGIFVGCNFSRKSCVVSTCFDLLLLTLCAVGVWKITCSLLFPVSACLQPVALLHCKFSFSVYNFIVLHVTSIAITSLHSAWSGRGNVVFVLFAYIDTEAIKKIISGLALSSSYPIRYWAVAHVPYQ